MIHVFAIWFHSCRVTVLSYHVTFLLCHVTLPTHFTIYRLVCDGGDRLGYRVDELKAHPFFHGTDWDHIRDRPAAIQVHVKHMADTSNFDDFEELDEKKRCEDIILLLMFELVGHDVFNIHNDINFLPLPHPTFPCPPPFSIQ